MSGQSESQPLSKEQDCADRANGPTSGAQNDTGWSVYVMICGIQGDCRLMKVPLALAEQAQVNQTSSQRQPIEGRLAANSTAATPRRIDGPDHLNADERRFIDEREHISIVGLYIDINERRASECPPRPPLSNVWPVNWHRGRGRWHFEDGDPDMEKIDRWLKARDW